MMGKSIHKGIGSGITALPGRAKDRGGGWKTDKEIERQLSSKIMEIPGTVCLGRHHSPESLPVNLDERAVIEHSCCMKDAPQRLLCGVGGLHDSSSIRWLRHVGLR